MTFFHMTLKGVIAWLVIKVAKLPVPAVSWRDFWLQACPIGASTGLDIACSNISFMYVTVTFATMVKPCGLLWTCALAIAMRLEESSTRLLMVIGCIFSGVFLAGFGETSFSPVGFVFVMLSTLFSAVRWVFTQVMLTSSLKADAVDSKDRHEAGLFTSGPVVLLLMISPSASISLIPLIFYTGEASLVLTFLQEEDTPTVLWSAAAVCLAALMAFFLLLFELYIVALSSSLSLNVIGTFKEMVTIAAGVLLFGDQINGINGLGVVVTVVGIGAYNHHRYHKLSDKLAMEREAAEALELKRRRQSEGPDAEAGEHSRLLNNDDQQR
jgi:solute carrier family 35 protein C2|eukprot:COSAG02_NODE_2298_length_9193_cov_83.003189_2_plen_326_part_00